MDGLKKIPKFQNYAIDTRGCVEIVNLKQGKKLKPTKKTKSKMRYFKLYNNGVAVTLSLFQILNLTFGAS